MRYTIGKHKSLFIYNSSSKVRNNRKSGEETYAWATGIFNFFDSDEETFFCLRNWKDIAEDQFWRLATMVQLHNVASWNSNVSIDSDVLGFKNHHLQNSRKLINKPRHRCMLHMKIKLKPGFVPSHLTSLLHSSVRNPQEWKTVEISIEKWDLLPLTSSAKMS